MNKKKLASYKIIKQNGFVLVVSLVFLAALTAVAAALMQNSTTDMKMSGATEDKSVAIQEAISAVDEVIFNELVPGGINRFARSINGADNFPIPADQLLPGTLTNSTATIRVANFSNSCGSAEEGGNSENRIGCNHLVITTTRNFGRNNQSTVNVNSGIKQQYIKNN